MESSDPVDRLLPPARSLALEHAVEGALGWGEIAARVGVAPSTLAAWRRDPVWAGELRRMQRERRETAARRADAEIPASIRTLIAIRDDVSAPPAVRRSCARDLLEIAGVIGPHATPLEPEPPTPMSSERLADFILAKAQRSES